MITKLPRWVRFGAWALAFVAGMINVVGLVGFEHQAVTHLTGTTSMIAAALAAREAGPALWLAAVIGSFVAGCVVSGFLTRDDASSSDVVTRRSSSSRRCLWLPLSPCSNVALRGASCWPPSPAGCRTR